MDKNRQYYLDLAGRWFDAETTEAEELELRNFLAGTEDPSFDEVRAAFGYLAAERAAEEAPQKDVSRELPSSASQRTLLRFWPAVAVAASVAAAFFLGRMSATDVTLAVEEGGSYYSYVNGVEVPGEDYAVQEMESTLEGLFAPAPDPADDLNLMFGRK